jgi:hypothetical protein
MVPLMKHPTPPNGQPSAHFMLRPDAARQAPVYGQDAAPDTAVDAPLAHWIWQVAVASHSREQYSTQRTLQVEPAAHWARL